MWEVTLTEPDSVRGKRFVVEGYLVTNQGGTAYFKEGDKVMLVIPAHAYTMIAWIGK